MDGAGLPAVIDLAQRVRKLVDDCQKAPERLRMLQQDVASLQPILDQLGAIQLSDTASAKSLVEAISGTDVLIRKIQAEIVKVNQPRGHVFARQVQSFRMQRTVSEMSEWSTELQKKKTSLGLLLSTLSLGLQAATHEGREDKTANKERKRPRITADEFLDALRAPNYVDDRLRIKQASEGTAEWIYKCPEYQEWIDSADQVASVHIVGKMGSGKSVLMKNIITGQGLKGFNGSGVRVLYYFCTCVNREETGLLILKSLVSQLVTSYPATFEEHVGNMDVLRLVTAKTSYSFSFEMLKSIFATLLQYITLETLYCAIDALDECDFPSLDEFIQLTQEIGKGRLPEALKVRFIFSSREFAPIIATLDAVKACPRIYIRPQTVAADIHLAMQEDFSRLRKDLDLEDEETQKLQQTLIVKSDGMFLWVLLAIKEILHSGSVFTGEDLEALVHDLPKGLKGLYEKAWENLLHSLPSERVSLAQRLLLWVLLAERPLTIPELTTAMAVELGSKRTPSPQKLIRSLSRFILSSLHPFVEVVDKDHAGLLEDRKRGPANQGLVPPGPIVRLIHQSAQEFLLGVCKGESQSTSFSIDIRVGHEVIARTCISYLQCEELQLGWHDLDNTNEYGLQVLTEETRQVIRQRLQSFPLLNYASCYWSHHVRMCQYHDRPPHYVADLPQDDIFKITLDFLENYPQGYDCAFQAKNCVWGGGLDVAYGPLPFFSTAISLGISTLVRRMLQDPRNNLFEQSSCGELPIHSATTTRPFFEHPEERSHITAMLLNAGADINSVGKAGDTPLHGAARSPDPHNVKLLLKRGANPSLVNEDGQTPLNQIDALESLEVVKMLVAAGTDMDIPISGAYGWYTPLMTAVNAGLVDTVRCLIESGCKVDSTTSEGWSALSLAVHRGRVDIVDLILNTGVDPDVVEGNSCTALERSIVDDKYDIAQSLLIHGASPIIRGEYGFCSLHARLSPRVLTLLLSYQSDPNVYSDNQSSPLHTAVLNNNPECVSILLKHGALVDAKRNTEPTRSLSVAAGLGFLDCVKPLLDHGADINAFEETNGETPLIVACQAGHFDVVRTLVERGADIDQVDVSKNYGSLHVAARGGWTEIVEYLIDQGASIHLQGYGKVTPFQACAALSGQLETAKILLRRGAKTDGGPDDYPTFGVACFWGHADVVRWMMEEGIDATVTIDTMIWECEKQEGHVAVAEALLERGLSPDAPGFRGGPPIFACIIRDRYDILEVLYQRGADLNILDDLGNTPLDIASWTGKKPEMMAFLLNHGADMSRSKLDWANRAARGCMDPAILEVFEAHGIDTSWSRSQLADLTGDEAKVLSAIIKDRKSGQRLVMHEVADADNAVEADGRAYAGSEEKANTLLPRT